VKWVWTALALTLTCLVAVLYLGLRRTDGDEGAYQRQQPQGPVSPVPEEDESPGVTMPSIGKASPFRHRNWLVSGRICGGPSGDQVSITLRSEEGQLLGSTTSLIPGAFEVESKAQPGIVELRACYNGLLLRSRWLRSGQTGVVLHLPDQPRTSEIRFTVADGSGGHRRSPVQVRIWRATGLDSAGAEEAFRYLRGVKRLGAAVYDRLVTSRMGQEGASTYSVSGLMSGRYSVLVDSGTGDRALRTVTLGDDQVVHLGEVSLGGHQISVHVTDGATGMPISGAEVRELHGLSTLVSVRRTGADGLAEFNCLGNMIWIGASGYASRRIAAPSGRIDVSLQAAPMVKVRAPTGWWVLSITAGQQFAVSGKEGFALLTRPTKPRAYFAKYDPITHRYEGRPLLPSGPVEGPCNVSGRVSGLDQPLSVGQITFSLQSEEGELNGLQFTSVISDGSYRLDSMPEGRYRIIVRPGDQIHDNDHELFFPACELTSGENVWSFQNWPDGVLTIVLLGLATSDRGSPEVRLFGEGLRYRGQYNYRISSSVQSRDLREVRFEHLPEGSYTVLVGGRRYEAVVPGVERLEIDLR